MFSTHVCQRQQQQQKHNIDLAHEQTSNDRFFLLFSDLSTLMFMLMLLLWSCVMMAIKSNYKFLMHRQ